MGKSADQPEEKRHTKWSADELTHLGDLLLYEIPIQEIARLLGRELDDVENKGRRDRASAPLNPSTVRGEMPSGRLDRLGAKWSGDRPH
jgi:hypothetical protein